MAMALPTLKGLRAFEEAYRMRSFTAAAQELNVQQPAISYQIKRLEEDLGVLLFDKRAGRPVPTAEAHELFETLSRSFDAIRTVANDLRRSTVTPSFTIATYPGIGTYWLSQKLPFLSDALGLKTKLVTVMKDAELWREESDCWIAFGRGDWQGYDARLLIREEVCAVAAPGVAEQLRAAGNEFSTAGIPIIEQDDPENRWLGWDSWFKHTKKTSVPTEKRITVNDHGLALHMALAGNGVALAWLGVVDGLLTSQSLIRLSSDLLTSGSGYWLVGRSGFFDSEPGLSVYDRLVAR